MVTPHVVENRTEFWRTTAEGLQPGKKDGKCKGGTAALPFFKQAVHLDPKFAMAYRTMEMPALGLDSQLLLSAFYPWTGITVFRVD